MFLGSLLLPGSVSACKCKHKCLVEELLTVLVTSNLRDSNEIHIILLKASVIACERGCRSAAPSTDSAKGFKLPWMMDLTHVRVIYICALSNLLLNLSYRLPFEWNKPRGLRLTVCLTLSLTFVTRTCVPVFSSPDRPNLGWSGELTCYHLKVENYCQFLANLFHVPHCSKLQEVCLAHTVPASHLNKRETI